ncbi:hypothetical protein [Streptococcus pluranimalium]|uniref:hypothetical protein n=1 Tax=Streptococcus pluranimalium TaxID=82348 RepID=UPI0039FCFCAE
MFIKELSIISKNSDEVLRRIEFRKGVNFIADTEESDKHNSVGKTTCLKLIDLSLGSKDKKAIYTDFETKNVNERLRDFIENNKVLTEMILIDSFDNPSQEISIKTELFNRGKRFINGEEITLKDLHNFLNISLFRNYNAVPTFRKVIKPFVRILMTKDNNQFLNVLDKFGKKQEYRALYNFLFDISNPKINSEIGKLQTELKQLEYARQRYNKVGGFTEVDEINQINDVLTTEIIRLELEVNDIVDRKSFEENRHKINGVRQRYEELTRVLAQIDFDLSRNQAYINEINEQFHREVNEELISDFFSEMSQLIPEITKTFSDLVEFNKQLNHNKLKYLKDRHDALWNDKEDLETEITALVRENSNFISLVEANKVDVYYDKVNELDKLKLKQAQNQAVIKSISRFNDEEEQLQSRLRELEITSKKSEDSYKQKLEIFNKYFKDIATSVNKEYPILIYHSSPNDFPISVSHLTEGTGTGTRKSLIASYDVAYQLFANEIKKSVPNFIVHDVLESIEGEDLKSLVEIVEATDIQYISAILKEKLVSSGLSEAEQNEIIVLELSTNNRLFEGELING